MTEKVYYWHFDTKSDTGKYKMNIEHMTDRTMYNLMIRIKKKHGIPIRQMKWYKTDQLIYVLRGLIRAFYPHYIEKETVKKGYSLTF